MTEMLYIKKYVIKFKLMVNFIHMESNILHLINHIRARAQEAVGYSFKNQILIFKAKLF